MQAWNRLLVFDDDPDIGQFVSEVGRGLGLEVDHVQDLPSFIESYNATTPGIILLDLMIPGTDGVQVLKYLGERRCECDIFLFSGVEPRLLNTAMRLGSANGLKIKEAIQKPISVDAMEALFSKYLNSARPITSEDVKSAIGNRQLIVHFQPIVDLKSAGQATPVIGFEALVRWQRNEGGLLLPDTFIPLVESADLMGELTNLVLDQSAEAMVKLEKAGFALDAAVNLSPSLLDDPTLPDRFAEKLESHGLPPSRLIVEITESAAITDSSVTLENLAHFRLRGFRLSLDDFGTGYSTLIQLHRMPFSHIKIDKSFVLEADSNPDAGVIVKATADLAHNLGLSVCAEGIETRSALNYVRSVGCDQGQGFHFSRPLGFADLERFLSRSGMRLVSDESNPKTQART